MRSALLIACAVILLLLIVPYFGLSFASKNSAETTSILNLNTNNKALATTADSKDNKNLKEIQNMLEQPANGKDK